MAWLKKVWAGVLVCVLGHLGGLHFVVLSGGISGRMKALSELIFIALSIEFLAEFVPR